MRILGVILAVSGTAGQGVPASPMLDPAGKWIAQYDDDGCALVRRFGVAPDIVTLVLKPSTDLRNGEVYLILPASTKSGARDGTGTVQLGPDGSQTRIRWAMTTQATDQRRLFGVEAGRDFWAELPTAQSLVMNFGQPAPIALATGPMAIAMNAAKACEDDLIRHWGGDPAALLPAEALDAARMISSGDSYPADALSAGQEGKVIAMVGVDPAGKPESCAVVVSSGSVSLDRATCEKIRRAGHFTPAAVGGPPKRYFVFRMQWRLPKP